ncbi:hypothetical protein HD806DRAFT_490424 [Xylariaceae sp. AK1471]|nr:hypothetical protein HD806DRAFT_490424 [Xylariaceae sp. AK1471]
MFAPASFLYEMMVLSFLNYQADEFMEACAWTVFRCRTDALRQVIDRAFLPTPNSSKDLTWGSVSDIDRSSYAKVLTPLTKFVSYVLNHPCVLAASSWDREHVKRELRTFLYAHVTQLEDNSRFQQQQPRTEERQQPGCATAYTSSTDSFFHWVRTKSADHTSCPYSFSFVGCLMSARLLNSRDCFFTVHEQYLAAVSCRHLATMCRMYNDYGSITRNVAEGNLNSINFTEYQSTAGGTTSSVDVQKRALFDLAEYERTCLDDSLRRLAGLSRKTGDAGLDRVKDRQMEIWRMFCDVTDLYGQIYVVRDIGIRTAALAAGTPSAVVNAVRGTALSELIPSEPSHQAEKSFRSVDMARTGLVVGH